MGVHPRHALTWDRSDLLLYVDKEPRPGEHENFTSPLWKQCVGSTIHSVLCLNSN